jgi:hypothetical protein
MTTVTGVHTLRDVLSVIGTDRPGPPVGGRPHSTDSVTVASGHGDMTDVDESAVDKNASFRRIRSR